MMTKLTIDKINNNNLLLYRYVRGSTLYGINLETSDVDEGGVYLAPLDHIIGLGFDYQDEVKDERGDLSYYELNKYLHLLIKSNPNILESLYVPDKFVIGEVHPLMKEIIANKEQFLTKQCFDSFLGYAYTQIKKARGMNKKVFKPMVQRKDVLDFCYTFYKNGSTPIKNFLKDNGLKQEYCGLTKINNMYEMYHLYYDIGSHILNEKSTPKYFNDNNINNKEVIGYKGICNLEADSNEVRLSSIPKGEEPICQLSFNKDAYSSHCKEYKEFKEWEERRNPIRFQQTINAGKGYDQKNLTHCIRLMHMTKEIANGEGFNVVRTHDKEMLMDIRLGKVDYDYLINYAENLKKEIEELIPKCKLPEKVDSDFVNSLLINIRKEQFKLI